MVCTVKSLQVLGLSLLLVAAVFGCNRAATDSEAPAAKIPAEKKTDIQPAGNETAAPADAPKSDPKHPEVLIETAFGNIRVRLNGEKSPLTVDNFLNYVERGYYDQTIVHQVYKGQGIVAGGYGADYKEIPTRTPVRNEAENGLKNLRGTISMVRYPDVTDSATSQFFINVSDNPALDHKSRTLPEEYGYCVFGEIVEGMDVVDRISQVEVKEYSADLDQTPVDLVMIKSIRRVQ